MRSRQAKSPTATTAQKPRKRKPQEPQEPQKPRSHEAKRPKVRDDPRLKNKTTYRNTPPYRNLQNTSTNVYHVYRTSADHVLKILAQRQGFRVQTRGRRTSNPIAWHHLSHLVVLRRLKFHHVSLCFRIFPCFSHFLPSAGFHLSHFLLLLVS